jgi:DnaJ-domain-containing protein 1
LLCPSPPPKHHLHPHTSNTQHPAALPREIKAAYYALMRTHHPDTASAADHPEATAFAALLNQIYQVHVVWH